MRCETCHGEVQVICSGCGNSEFDCSCNFEKKHPAQATAAARG